MPLSTEHQGICSYTPNQIVCPIPCNNDPLQSQSKLHPQHQNYGRYDTTKLCGEMDFSLERQNSYSSIPPINIE